KLFDVVRDGSSAQIEAGEQLCEEAIVDPALREVELALVEQVHEQAEPVRIGERSEHASETIHIGLGHAPSLRRVSNCVNA
ncbi:MAG: hypothetical protein JWO36_7314, partial [Myxococcales bacterium]|nr:hypothetical protein [Myxococcales bacterium]